MIEFIPRNLYLQNLYLIQYGMEACTPGHAFGPSVREYYKIHYVLDGEGIFEYGGKSYHLGKGSGFLICPGEVAYYKANTDNPWEYCWIGFNGTAVQHVLKEVNLTSENPVFYYEQVDSLYPYIQKMTTTGLHSKGRDLTLNGLLHMFLGALSQNRDDHGKTKAIQGTKESYVQQVLDFIELNYDSKITIESIASKIGLQRNYLSTIFKEHTNTSMQNYLIRYRLDKACELLENPALSIGDVARSVSYEDPLLFSKIFKKTLGIAPSVYRKQR